MSEELVKQAETKPSDVGRVKPLTPKQLARIRKNLIQQHTPDLIAATLTNLLERIGKGDMTAITLGAKITRLVEEVPQIMIDNRMANSNINAGFQRNKDRGFEQLVRRLEAQRSHKDGEVIIDVDSDSP